MKAISVGILLLGVMISCSGYQGARSDKGLAADVRHGVLFYQENRYAGWPANNGIWNWDNEILVGFVEADHKTTDGLHTYDQSSARHKYARSTDGGERWKIEDAFDRDGRRGERSSIPSDWLRSQTNWVTTHARFTDPGVHPLSGITT